MSKVDNDIIFYAFRYALGRKTYAVKDVSDYIVNHWEEIDPLTQQLIWGEIDEAIKRGEAGMSVDELAWARILELLVKEGTK